MGRKEQIGEIILQLEKLDDGSLEYLSHWSMPWGVLPLLHDFEDGKLMRDVDCDMHVALECQERDELIRDMWRCLSDLDVGLINVPMARERIKFYKMRERYEAFGIGDDDDD